jgi:hypothetical protein
MSTEKTALPKIAPVEGVDDLFEVSPDAVRKLQTDEIVIGLCAPAGSPVHKVAEELKRLLVQRYGYECEVIRLSRLIEEIDGSVQKESRFERVQGLIEKGNSLRRRFGHSVLADLSISRIAKAREKAKIAAGATRYADRRICYIIDSIKNSDELEILRLVYREMFYFMGVFAPLHVRQKELETEGMALEQVHKIIDRDSGEELAHGQLVRATFPMADFFLRTGAGSDKELSSRLERSGERPAGTAGNRHADRKRDHFQTGSRQRDRCSRKITHPIAHRVLQVDSRRNACTARGVANWRSARSWRKGVLHDLPMSLLCTAHHCRRDPGGVLHRAVPEESSHEAARRCDHRRRGDSGQGANSSVRWSFSAQVPGSISNGYNTAQSERTSSSIGPAAGASGRQRYARVRSSTGRTGSAELGFKKDLRSVRA